MFADSRRCSFADIQKILHLCCDADFSVFTGSRQSSDRDPAFVTLAKNAVGHISVLKPPPQSPF